MTRLSGIFNDFPGFLLNTLISLPVILIALSVHELCHGLVAYRCGDTTAKSMGRLSLNPLKHIDPVGFLMLLFVGFGFAKPVMVNPRNLKKPRRDMAFVSAAGPLSNLALGFLGVLFLYLYWFFLIPAIFRPGVELSSFMTGFLDIFLSFLTYFCYINIGLFIFNLLPIPPLDGSKIVYAFLPPRILFKILPYERYSQLILIVLLFAGALTNVLGSAVGFIFDGFYQFWNLIFGGLSAA